MDVINTSEQITNINVVEQVIDVNVVEEVITIEAPTGGYILPATVFSVFGRTGAVIGQAGDYNTSQVTESGNLYFTDARARTAISLTTTGTSGAATYSTVTGILNIPQYQGGVTSFNTRTGAITLISADVTSALGFTPYNATNPAGYLSSVSLTSNVTGTLPIANGGTSATTASGARTALGLAIGTDVLAFRTFGTAANNNTGDFYLSTNPSAFIALTALSAGTGISYNNTTGVITNSAPDQTVSLSNGAGISVTGTYPSFTIASTITQYTDALARAAITLTTTGTGGAATYNTTTGVLNIPQYIGGVTSVFGRTGAVVATEGDYSLTQLSDVTITSPTNGQVLKYNGTAWVNGTDSNTGTVTSVGLSAPTGFSVTNSPIISSGTLALAFATGYSLPTDASQTNWNTAYTNRITSLTTTGSSGAATLVSNTLNIPTYTLTGLGGQPLSANLTSLAGLTFASTSFVKMTASGTFALDTNTYQGTLTLTTTGSSGSASLVSNTLNIPTYTLSGLGGVPTSRTLTINGVTYDLSADRAWTVSGGGGGTTVNARTEYEFTTNGSTATYTAAYTVGQVDVFYNGSKLSAAEFTATNGTSVTLNFTPPSGQFVEVVAWLGMSAVPSTRTLTINGVTYDLSADRAWTISSTSLEAKRLITEVYNSTGATLTKGTVVYINGGQGNLPTVTKALAVGDSTSAQTYGLVQADITNMNNGFVVVIGSLADIDTQLYPNGTQLYLSPTTAGAWTSTKPYAPNHLVYIGIVVRSHPTQGVIEVKIQNGYEMDELHDVSAQSPTNGDILQYVAATDLWTKTAGTTTNIAEGTRLYYTDTRARASISLTTTGSSGAATYDNTTGVLNIPQYSGGGGSGMAIGGSITSATLGSVLFAGASGVLAQDNANFFWDDTNDRLNIGSSTTGFFGSSLFVSQRTTNYAFEIKTTSAKTSTTLNKFIALSSSDATSPQYLEIGIVGAATNSNRYFSFQTSEFLIADSGNIVFQPRGGNFAVGTATIGSRFQVNGNAAIGYSASTAAPTNGLAVAGNSTLVGSITTNNVLNIDIASGNGNLQYAHSGAYKWALGSASTSFDFFLYNYGLGTNILNILNTNGFIGIRTGTIGSNLQINGNAAIGYSASTAAPTNGLAVSGAATIQTLTIGLGNSSVATNTAIGFQALNANTSGAGQTAVGYQAMNGQLATGTTTDPNVAVGYQAMLTNTGASNTAIGGNAMRSGTNSYNTTVGSNSMRNITSGGSNTALGQGAMQNVSTGSSNSAFGNVALLNIGTGSNNMAFGQNAFVNLVDVSNNIAIGCNAARFTGSGTTPTTSNTNSIYIGFDVRPQSTSTTNEIIISGYNGTAPIVGNGSNTTLIGNGSTTATYIYGSITTPSTVTATSFVKSGGTAAQYLMADGSVTTGTGGAATMSIGSSITSATAGSILFVGAGGVLAQDNAGFFFDVANDRLGIGTATPAARLEISGSTTAASSIARGSIFSPTLVAAANNDVLSAVFINPTFTNGAFTGVKNYALNVQGASYFVGKVAINTTNPQGNLEVNSGSATAASLYVYNTLGSYTANQLLATIDLGANDNGNIRSAARISAFNLTNADSANGYLTFSIYNGAVVTERMRLLNSGFLGLGTTTPIRLLSLGSGAGASAGLSTNVKLALYDDGTTNNIYGLGISSGMFEIQTAGDIGFYTGGTATRTERMRFTGGGLLGIGTATIGSTLQINGNAAIGYSASTAAPTNGLLVAGDINVAATGSTTTTPRVMGITSLGAGNAGRIQFGDLFNCWQTSNGGLMQLVSYHGMQIYGARINNGASFITAAGTDPSLNVIGTEVGRPTLVVTAAASQTANIQQWRNSGGTVLASMSNAGSITAVSFIRTGGLSTQYLMADGSVTTGGGGGSVTLSAIGSTPNANGATLTGSALNLEPASASFGGVVTTGVQTFAGAKTFNSSVTAGSFIKSGGTSTQYLMADGSVTTGTGGTVSMTIGGSIVGSTVGSILFVGTSGVLEQDNADLFWDATNNRLGVDTNTVGSALQVNGNAAIGYSASTAAPTNGLAVSGATTIGGDATISGVLIQTVTTNRQTASYTLALSDRGKLVEMNVATANNLTVPLNSTAAFPIGTQIDISQYGAGQTTVVATVGVTIRSTNSWLKINARYGAATLIKIATDEWYLFGNLNA